ncbi:MAG: mechanosensitive ion channel family protein [Candidatus Nealsonbacteria bacterium]|nr:MAG: mechanosensitive ion channel family protein [Candidatus Nealsonbacteria bacterium]
MLETLYSWLLAHGIKILVVLSALILINRVGKNFIERAVRKAVKEVDHGAEEKRENTLIRIFSGSLKVVLWLVALMTILPEFGIEVGPVLAGAGVLGVALGFGAQWMIRDFLAGLFIILENQYRVGDVVCLDNTCGGVEDITLRKTVMRDLDGKVYHIPNGSFKMAANLTKDYSRAHMDISVAYKEDLDKVMELINKVGQEMTKDEPWKDYIIKPIQVMGPGPNKFGDSGVEIKVLGETKPLKQWDTLKEFRRRLKAAFDKEGVEIPFPQMSIWPRGNWEKEK